MLSKWFSIYLLIFIALKIKIITIVEYLLNNVKIRILNPSDTNINAIFFMKNIFLRKK